MGMDARARWTLAAPMALLGFGLSLLLVQPVALLSPDRNVFSFGMSVESSTLLAQGTARPVHPSIRFALATLVCAVVSAALCGWLARMLDQWFDGSRPAALLAICGGPLAAWAFLVLWPLLSPSGIATMTGESPVDLVAYSVVLLAAVAAVPITQAVLSKSHRGL